MVSYKIYLIQNPVSWISKIECSKFENDPEPDTVWMSEEVPRKAIAYHKAKEQLKAFNLEESDVPNEVIPWEGC